MYVLLKFYVILVVTDFHWIIVSPCPSVCLLACLRNRKTPTSGGKKKFWSKVKVPISQPANISFQYMQDKQRIASNPSLPWGWVHLKPVSSQVNMDKNNFLHKKYLSQNKFYPRNHINYDISEVATKRRTRWRRPIKCQKLPKSYIDCHKLQKFPIKSKILALLAFLTKLREVLHRFYWSDIRDAVPRVSHNSLIELIFVGGQDKCDIFIWVKNNRIVI